MSKYKGIIDEARKPASQTTGTQEPIEDEGVNLSIKVPRSLRRHWVVEAKRQDTSLTAVIIQALKSRFGEPE